MHIFECSQPFLLVECSQPSFRVECSHPRRHVEGRKEQYDLTYNWMKTVDRKTQVTRRKRVICSSCLLFQNWPCNKFNVFSISEYKQITWDCFFSSLTSAVKASILASMRPRSWASDAPNVRKPQLLCFRSECIYLLGPNHNLLSLLSIISF